jgi:hypothetical protein
MAAPQIGASVLSLRQGFRLMAHQSVVSVATTVEPPLVYDETAIDPVLFDCLRLPTFLRSRPM